MVQRQVEEEEELKKKKKKEEEEYLLAKNTTGKTPEVTPDIESRIQSLKGGGQSLPESVRTYFEPRFGVDFGQVRVHSDAEAALMNRELNAQAFTHWQDVFFGAGRYSPESSEGKRLLAHELAHVVQQTGSDFQRKLTIGQPRQRYEQEADRVAEQVMLMSEAQVRRQIEEEKEEEELIQPKALSEQISPLIQRVVEPQEERVEAVKKACEVCDKQWDVPKIIKKLNKNIVAIHPKRVEQFKPLAPEIRLMIAYPRMEKRPLMSDALKEGKFEYITVTLATPFTINRPDDPITFLGRTHGGYLVKESDEWLKALCRITHPVIRIMPYAKHKQMIRILATQYEEVFQQFKSLGQRERK